MLAIQCCTKQRPTKQVQDSLKSLFEQRRGSHRASKIHCTNSIRIAKGLQMRECFIGSWSSWARFTGAWSLKMSLLRSFSRHGNDDEPEPQRDRGRHESWWPRSKSRPRYHGHDGDSRSSTSVGAPRDDAKRRRRNRKCSRNPAGDRKRGPDLERAFRTSGGSLERQRRRRQENDLGRRNKQRGQHKSPQLHCGLKKREAQVFLTLRISYQRRACFEWWRRRPDISGLVLQIITIRIDLEKIAKSLDRGQREHRRRGGGVGSPLAARSSPQQDQPQFSRRGRRPRDLEWLVLSSSE